MSLLIETSLRISLVMMGALAATALLKSQSAALRHWVLSMALVCAAATPLLGLVMPAWHLRVGGSTSVAPVAQPSVVTAIQIEQPAGASIAGEPSRTHATSDWVASGHLLAGVWIAGVAINLSVLLAGLLHLRSVASRAQRVSRGKWVDVADDVARAYGLHRRVRLFRTEHPTLLVTWGLWRPRVMMPVAADEWPEDRLRVVLSHELAHIRRGDWALQIAAELVRSAYWFNPLLWVACRRMRQESERACDDEVLGMGVDGPDYASHLVDLARAFSRHRRRWFPGLPGLPAPGIAEPSSLERRITAMLNVHLNRRPLTRWARAATAAALLGVTLPIAGLGAQAFATLSGTITDQTGSVVPGTTLTLSHAQSQAKHEVRSDATGHFQFVGLPAGDYRLKTEAAGFAPLDDRFLLASGQTAQRNVALKVGSLQETITVTDQTSLEPLRERPRPKSVSSPKKVCEASPVGGRILPPTKVYDVRPRFPQSLHDAQGTGHVTLEATISVDGSVKDVRAVAAVDPDMERAASDAVYQWRFTPTLLNCMPIDVKMKVDISFTRR